MVARRLAVDTWRCILAQMVSLTLPFTYFVALVSHSQFKSVQSLFLNGKSAFCLFLPML